MSEGEVEDGTVATDYTKVGSADTSCGYNSYHCYLLCLADEGSVGAKRKDN